MAKLKVGDREFEVECTMPRIFVSNEDYPFFRNMVENMIELSPEMPKSEYCFEGSIEIGLHGAFLTSLDAAPLEVTPTNINTNYLHPRRYFGNRNTIEIELSNDWGTRKETHRMFPRLVD